MELTTLTFLGTSIGAIAMTLGVVQYFKPKVGMRTRVLTWLIALGILLGVTALTDRTVAAFALAACNSIVVATSAMGTYELTFAKSDAKKKEV